jgi:cytochrome c oxidase cbb3-type subunit III
MSQALAWREAALGLLLPALVFLVGWQQMGPTPDDERAAAHERGRAIYNFRCYFCHGYSGDAKTLAATFLAPPPRDFSAATPAELPLERIAAAVREGRPGSAMQSYARWLDAREVDEVAAFVAREFVRDKARNSAYHTAANGWPDHERRHGAAFAFARGEIALDAPVESLGATAQEGRRLFFAACISCHDRARVDDAGPVWQTRPVSFPRMGFAPGDASAPPPVDAVTGASVYARHDVMPVIAGLSARERRGQALYQANCAFCHGADGSGKNWIGQFMEPHARDLGSFTRQQMSQARLVATIRDGLPQTSMPAWRHVLSSAQIDALAAYVRRAFVRPGDERAARAER